jgi:CBS domain-containing protein
MTIDVFAVRPDASLDIVLDVLIERGFGGAPVVEGDGTPIGVISRTDILGERLLPTAETIGPEPVAGHDRSTASRAPASDRAAQRITVADAMTRVAFTVSEGAPISEAAKVMVRRGVHRVVVVSEDGCVAGIVTTSDIVRWVAQQPPMAPSD